MISVFIKLFMRMHTCKFVTFPYLAIAHTVIIICCVISFYISVTSCYSIIVFGCKKINQSLGILLIILIINYTTVDNPYNTQMYLYVFRVLRNIIAVSSHFLSKICI